MNTNTTAVLQQVVCFSLEEISLWGARKKLQSGDLKLTKTDALPPKDLASLGSKKIFNPKALARFEALKKQAHVACARVGVRFLGGYAVPEGKADALAAALNKIGAEFEKEKDTFLANYQTILENWIAEHPGWESWIRTATISVEEVRGKIRYGWTPARVSAPDNDKPDSPLYQKMANEAGGLSGRLFSEIADMATTVMNQSLLGKAKVNRRVMSPIGKIRDKLHGLSFLDKRVSPLVKLIDDTVAQMPGDAPIEGVSLTALFGLTLTLSDPERMKMFGQAALDGTAQAADFGVVVPTVAPRVVPKVEVAPLAVQPAVAAEAKAEAQVVAKAIVKPAQPELQNIFADLFAAAAPQKQQVETPVEVASQEVPAVAVEVPVELPLVSAEMASQEVGAETSLPQLAVQESIPMVRVVEVVKPKEPATPAFVPNPTPALMRRVCF